MNLKKNDPRCQMYAEARRTLTEAISLSPK